MTAVPPRLLTDDERTTMLDTASTDTRPSGVPVAAPVPSAPAPTAPTTPTTSERIRSDADERAARRADRRAGLKRWWARFVVLAMLAGAVYGGSRLVEYRQTQQAHIDLGTVTLSAQPTPVSALTSGTVRSVAVRAQQKVVAGQVLGTFTVIKTSSTGVPVEDVATLTSPSDGVIVSEPAPVGATLGSGQTFVQLYNPAKQTFTTDLPISKLTHVSKGMRATLTAPGLEKPITAVVQRVVPRISTDPSAQLATGSMRLVLTPLSPSTVATLVPGFQFTGTLTADPKLVPSDGGVLAGS